MFSTILSYVGAVLVIAFMILAHELGHFCVGRACGMTIDKFAVGFGPKLFKWNRKGTEFSVRVFPIGGFCMFRGEDENSPDPKAFNNQLWWKRFLTLIAGVVSNLVLAVLLAIAVLAFYGDAEPVIAQVNDLSPAMEAGLQQGDIIRSFEGEDIDFSIEMALALNKAGTEEELLMTVERDGKMVDMNITRYYDETEGRYMAGFAFSQQPIYFTFFEAVGLSFKWLVLIVRQMLMFIGGLFTGTSNTQDVGGAILIVSTISKAIQIDFGRVMEITALLSVNLAVMNLLPFPALDGGRLVFVLLEAVRGKPIKQEVEGTIHAIGMFLLFGLMFLLLYKDVIRLWFGG